MLPAEYGHSGGGIASFTMKSGTNQLHGSVYEYFRNDALDARGFFPPDDTHEQAERVWTHRRWTNSERQDIFLWLVQWLPGYTRL